MQVNINPNPPPNNNSQPVLTFPAQRLAEIVPELEVVSAHGRMKAEALDEAVLAFAEGAHDVLLTTAIIETGLDIPGADTIIIVRPERTVGARRFPVGPRSRPSSSARGGFAFLRSTCTTFFPLAT